MCRPMLRTKERYNNAYGCKALGSPGGWAIISPIYLPLASPAMLLVEEKTDSHWGEREREKKKKVKCSCKVD